MRTMHLLPIMAGLSLGPSLFASTFYVTVAGLGGEPDYEQRFAATANELDKLFRGAIGAHVYTLSGKEATLTRLTEVLHSVGHDANSEDDLIVTLIGHGTFDGTEYKFNLIGPDITAAELARLCDRVASKRQLIVNTTSASGGSVAALQRPGRAVISATKSGTEKNATIFARYWVEALSDPMADLDKSGSISALETFRYAEGKTVAFFETQKRLATEHAVFEDTGRGEAVRTATPERREGALLANLSVVRFGSAQAIMNDPAKRELLIQKENLEEKIDTLKYQKAAMELGEYKQQLTSLLVQLANVQGELDR